ncbi:ketosamine-3-kinase-like [Centruroides vittatus]|uniref:ketosamine-3-kinase-like n=1 Tax=Centruroides vittatus TaxID=120091 RepID=UPI00351075C4
MVVTCTLYTLLEMALEAKVKEILKTSVFERTGKSGGGCINEGEGYRTDTGEVFLKRNSKPEARLMFDGELASLKAILATRTVKVPDPIVVVDNPKGGAVLVMEYVNMKSLSKYSAQLGEQLGKLHKHNKTLKDKEALQSKSIHKDNEEEEEEVRFINQFGFHTTTCCGYIAQDNTWKDDWVEFYARQRLNHQIQLIEKDYGDRETIQLWSELQLKLPKFFKDIEIVPSLLHGDLWGGNVGETDNEPIIFDPATFYGHSEFELAIAKMFGGFNSSFFSAYHKELPKQQGFDTRLKLYQLFHYLNHWNHFGSGYRGSSTSIMKSMVKM